MKESTEILVHFSCGFCNKWWSIGDAPPDRLYWFCPWCGTKNERKEVEMDIETARTNLRRAFTGYGKLREEEDTLVQVLEQFIDAKITEIRNPEKTKVIENKEFFFGDTAIRHGGQLHAHSGPCVNGHCPELTGQMKERNRIISLLDAKAKIELMSRDFARKKNDREVSQAHSDRASVLIEVIDLLNQALT